MKKFLRTNLGCVCVASLKLNFSIEQEGRTGPELRKEGSGEVLKPNQVYLIACVV